MKKIINGFYNAVIPVAFVVAMLYFLVNALGWPCAVVFGLVAAPLFYMIYTVKA